MGTLGVKYLEPYLNLLLKDFKKINVQLWEALDPLIMRFFANCYYALTKVDKLNSLTCGDAGLQISCHC